MSKESRYSPDSRLAWRETFNSFDDIAKNGGTLGIGTTISNGIMTTISTAGTGGTYLGQGNKTFNAQVGAITIGCRMNTGRTRLFNKELSQTEVTRLYNSQRGRYGL